MTQLPIDKQMAALNGSNDSSYVADRSNSLLNATCPAIIQSDRRNASMCESSSSGGKAPRHKREPFKITPLAQIDEVPRRGILKHPDNYKTRLCDAFSRQGFCPYNDKCRHAHGRDELRLTAMRKPQSTDHYRSRSRKDDRNSSFGRSSSRTENSVRFGRDESDRSESRRQYEKENQRNQSSTTSSNRDRDRDNYGQRPICHNFQRGSCSYGPRCRYLHVEQMATFNPNATIYVPPSEIPQVTFYQNGPNFVPMVPMMHYYYQQGPPPPPQHQFVTYDFNQTGQMMAPSPVGTTYYYQPLNPTPVMDQSMTQTVHSVEQTFPEGFFTQPPPTIIS